MAAPRHTAHVRHRHRHAGGEVAPDQHFLFRQDSGAVVGEAGNLRQFLLALAGVPAEVLERHAERGDYSRWVLDVFADQALGQYLRKIEARWRRREIADMRGALAQAVLASCEGG
jgi:hypothetical protein